jgi:hypothetical protein
MEKRLGSAKVAMSAFGRAADFVVLAIAYLLSLNTGQL